MYMCACIYIKVAYVRVKRGLLYMAKEAYWRGKRGLLAWQKRPIGVAKEAY